MAARRPPSASANFRVSLSATEWAACFVSWFIVMGAIAIFAGDKPVAIPALIAVLLGGVILAAILHRGGGRPQ